MPHWFRQLVTTLRTKVVGPRKCEACKGRGFFVDSKGGLQGNCLGCYHMGQLPKNRFAELFLKATLR